MALILVVRLSLFVAATVALLCAMSTAITKECTNSPQPLSSHTFRAELSSSKNQSWRHEVLSHYHLIHTEDDTWAHLMPRKILREQSEVEEWALMYRKLKNSAGSNSESDQRGFLKEVSLHNVRLDPSSAHWRAQETNLQYLLLLDVDSLVWSFRKTAGLDTPGKPYGGWEDKNGELRGHFVGHYLSAMAKMWASTHNATVKAKMSAVVTALLDCQEKMGSGYLSAFPSEQFDRFEAVQYVWAPYYTIHKIMAGLLDQYTYANDTRALKMLVWMVDYFYKRVQNVIAKYTIDRHWMSLNEETGGMNDVLYNLFTVTKDVKHLLLAHLFDKPCFLGLLALQVDDLSNFHANTHIPVVIGAQMRYEVTGDPLYKTIGTYFMDIVNSSHSYATGGTSAGEFWQDPKRLATTLETENEESCTTYNMLKVSRNLFRWTKEVAYADYYERALANGVLSIQRGTNPGVMIYMLPLGRGVSKAVSYHGWGTPFNSFWCCYGTAIESFSKLGDSIYFEEQAQTPGIYVTQYISSSLDWKSGKMIITQTVDPVVSWDPYLRVKFKISSTSEVAAESTLNLRIPSWSDSSSAEAELNGQKLTLPSAGNFLTITKKWNSTEELTLELPLSLRIEAIKDDRSEYSSLHAILYGPYLLAGLTDGDWDIAATTTSPLSDWIAPVPASYNSQLLTLSQPSANRSFVVSTTSTGSSSSSITMQEKFPNPGTNPAARSTFKLIVSKDAAFSDIIPSTPKDSIGKRVMLEPFNLPGTVIVAKGDNESLVVEQVGSGEGGWFFRLMSGLDGNGNTVSLESESHKGCYVFSGVNYNSGDKLVLRCSMETAEFRQGSSFVLNNGISQYDPMSFEAVGLKRGFLLFPLMSFTDESYTAYFNLQI